MGTSISRQLAQELQLDEIGEIDIQGVTGTARCKTYLISLYLPNHVIIPEVVVSDCEGNIGCDVLIGMDVITLGDFSITNVGGYTCFSFRMPSMGNIDFVDFHKRIDEARNNAPNKPFKIGRNDPCVCGSGKKFKKCCGA